MLKESDKSSKELLGRKQSELEDVENAQPTHNAKNEKACSEGATKGVAEQSFDKETMGANQGLSQPFRQKPGIESGLYQFKLTGQKK